MADGPMVEMLRVHIESMGVSLYLAEHDPQPGVNLAVKVGGAIVDSDAVIALLTKAAADSPYVQQEIGLAKGANKLIVPIVQVGVDPRALGILTGLERIEVDLADPTAAMEIISKNLEPLVQAQAAKLAQQAAPREPVLSGALLLGLGLVLVALLLALSSD
jgi:hypothetical protein